MTFLNPLVLLGLAAAAIPVLLHLLNLRKLRTVDFSSVRFLKELQKTSMRRLQFRQILLLILRTLLIVALVMAFSRPTFRGSVAGVGKTAASSTMVLILDDSPSMSVRDERGTAFARAVQTATRATDLAGDGDRLYLIPLSELRTGTPFPPPRTAESARGALVRLSPTMISVPFREALARIRPLLAGSPDANREIMLVTDGQATQFAAGQKPADSSAAFDAGVRLFVMASPPIHHENIAVSRAEVLTRIITDKKPIRVRALLANTGEEEVRGCLVSLSCDGARVAQQSVDIPPRGTVQPVFSFIVKRRGLLACSVQVEDDAFDADNVFSFALNVPLTTSILLTGPDTASTQLAYLALTLAGDSLLAGHVSVRRMTHAELTSADLSRFDVIVICGFAAIAASAEQRIARFVGDGGGLILFPAPSAPPPYGTFFHELGIQAPGGPATQAAGSFLSFSRIDFAHPLFEGMFEPPGGIRRGEPEVESPRVGTAVTLSSGEKGTTVIGLSDGHAFLVDYAAGKGRVLAFAVEAGTSWSDFPVKGLFTPLLHRTVAYAALEATQSSPIVAGDPLRFSVRLKDFTDRDTYTVSAPGGSTKKVVPSLQAVTGIALFDGGTATATGIYGLSRDLRDGGGSPRDLQAIAANLAPAESDLRTVTDDELDKFGPAAGFAQAQIRMVPEGERVVENVRQARYGVELWRYFVMLAIVLALAEMAVGRAPRPQRGEEGEATRKKRIVNS